MTGAYLIAYGGKAPLDIAENRVFHQSLLDDLSREVVRQGWAGADFSHYGRADNRVAIEIVPGTEALTLERLAAFREEQRRAREAERQVA
ncbi:hypothetical protein GOZ96_22740 [Agrobacterium vitis]|uniref:Uncharacterized protein n=1 Tax=Agrobacterium vitis TaxID=373 RepID=A0A7J4X2S2_AGRVI|nr:hypothetical protein [Agrobacterium vitis]KAA3526105.1 hypothetical protein DXT89_16395 [Agrobacterium vitis]MUZ99387.1 hypothetical protein [Agrobacterium vitis]